MSCNYCQKRIVEFKCGHCSTQYCCEKCARDDWPVHWKQCNPIIGDELLDEYYPSITRFPYDIGAIPKDSLGNFFVFGYGVDTISKNKKEQSTLKWRELKLSLRDELVNLLKFDDSNKNSVQIKEDGYTWNIIRSQKYEDALSSSYKNWYNQPIIQIIRFYPSGKEIDKKIYPVVYNFGDRKLPDPNKSYDNEVPWIPGKEMRYDGKSILGKGIPGFYYVFDTRIDPKNPTKHNFENGNNWVMLDHKINKEFKSLQIDAPKILKGIKEPLTYDLTKVIQFNNTEWRIGLFKGWYDADGYASLVPSKDDETGYPFIENIQTSRRFSVIFLAQGNTLPVLDWTRIYGQSNVSVPFYNITHFLPLEYQEKFFEIIEKSKFTKFDIENMKRLESLARKFILEIPDQKLREIIKKDDIERKGK